jgi:hypothetical protein
MTTTQIKAQQIASLSVAAVVGGGTFAAATYFWKATAVGPWGESGASAEATVAVALNGSATLTIGAAPAGTHHLNVYRGTVTNTENKLIATLPAGTTTFTDTGTAGVTATCPATAAAFAALTKSGGVPTKAGVAAVEPAGLAEGLQLTAYAGAVGWCANIPSTTWQQRNQKYMAAAGLALQEV